MDSLTLPIFPEHTLAVSITTTVWVGVCIVAFFNLRFGWPLTGLVVPGYLAPLMIAKPMSVSVVIVEALITYAIVWLLSEASNRLPGWCSFFGRDRFFAIVIVSVLVRCTLDGWLLPWLGPKINELSSWNIDYRNHLHSYGLIIVALVANCFWKPGLIRGGSQLAVTLGATYLVVRYGLIEFTNFNVGSLQYVYEDIASSLLASPKAYIILLTTAFIASWLNLRYAWDYNGILIPALLALQLHEPLKILVTFAEALVVLLLAIAVLKLPFWGKTTMTGARRTLFFFNLTFAYRLAMGHVIPVLFPECNVTDLFGFGYLLSTLLAIRAHDTKMAVRIARASVQVSFVGAVAGSFIGFALSFLPDGLLTATSRAGYNTPVAVSSLDGRLVDLVRSDKLLLYQKRVPNSFVVPTAQELNAFWLGMQRLLAYRDQGGGRDDQTLRDAAALLARSNYRVHRVEDRYLYLRELSPPRGWGAYVLDLQNPTGAVVEVPAPLDEWATIESGLCLFQQLDAAAIAIAGAGRHTNDDGAADVLAQSHGVYSTFHRLACRSNAVEVRGVTRSNARQLGKEFESQSSAWIKGGVPRGVSLRKLSKLVAVNEIRWRATPLVNSVRDGTWSGFLELHLTRSDRRKLLAMLAAGRDASRSRAMAERRNEPLGDWLHDFKASIAARGSEAYLPAKPEELLFFDEQVLIPLLRIAAANTSVEGLSQSDGDELNAIASAAAIVGYQVTLFQDTGGGRHYLALSERTIDESADHMGGLAGSSGGASRGVRRNWGLFVFRFGLQDPYLVEVPRPLLERNAFEFGVSLLQRLPASGLLIAGAHPHANADGGADVTRISNKVNLFHLVHQVVLRELGDRRLLVVQARAMRAPVEADVTMATAIGATDRNELSRLQTGLLRMLESDGMRTQLADGSPQTAGYEAHGTVQVAAKSQTENKEFVSLWLSPTLRSAYRQHGEDDLQAAQFQAMGIPTIRVDLCDYLQGWKGTIEQHAWPDALRRDVQSYQQHMDIVSLRRIQKQCDGNRMLRVIDAHSRQAYLVIDTPLEPRFPLVCNLTPSPNGTTSRRVSKNLPIGELRKFVETRATFLEVGP